MKTWFADCDTIVPEEAVIVRRIFDLYLSGKGIQSIANTLNKEGYRTRLGAIFKDSGIHDILRNQAYSGNLLLQKTFRENHITKRTMINRGELPMYYRFNKELLISERQNDLLQKISCMNLDE